MKTTRYARRVGLVAVGTLVAVSFAACTSGAATGGFSDSAPSKLTGTVSLWHTFTDREAKAVSDVVAGFEKANPGVKVEIHSGQDDDKMTKKIASGSDIDVVISGSTDNLGLFCSSGAWLNLGKVIKRDHVDMNQFPAISRDYTSFQGNQCSLPLLADVYGLYYNTDQLAAAGYTQPPKTLDELETMALKLTTYNADGSIKTLGYDPLIGTYHNYPRGYAPAAAATWMDSKGQSDLADQPGWKELMTWQKAFVDKIGYDKLKTFISGLGQEYAADNPFQTGKISMAIDGEWRVGFLADQAPSLKYDTAPFPTAADHTDLYGGGYVSGTVAGIAKGSTHAELAWALLKYLTTNTAAVVKLSNGLYNVPTTEAALKSPDLSFPKQFDTFLQILGNKNVSTNPATAIGETNQTTFGDYWDKWQQGNGGDLDAGLKDVDKTINQAIQLSAQP